MEPITLISVISDHKVGKESAQYRGPVIWNFTARLANFNANIQKDSFKNILRRFSQNINSFLIRNAHDSYERLRFGIFLSFITLSVNF